METKKLKQIALDLKAKIEAGLKKDGEEIQCLPTYISPKTTNINGQAVVLDLGGTNYRMARVDFENGQPVIHPENGWKRDLSEMKNEGYTQEDLFKAQADPIGEIKLDTQQGTPIGYCFSYPAKSLDNGDARLLFWTKGVNIEEMIGKPVGEPLLKYFNEKKQLNFTGIKVINDTVASLFAGLTKPGYDAYIGLIVGTGTNMAAFMRSDKIDKLSPAQKTGRYIPVNLESGNFHPQHLSIYDEMVDANSDKKGAYRFEKAISGMYLGEIFKSAFPLDEFEEKFDAQTLTTMLSYPAIYKEEYVHMARWIYERSAQLVAASLAGLILVLHSHESSIRRVLLTSEGSLFWSRNRKGKDYSEMVVEELHNLLRDFGHDDLRVELLHMDNANLIGTAIAALS
ncbi:MAG: hexokinase [Prevotellaceae bacterium]|jgi:hexokinase|nr:hexokinase [Prevotellaceae bacterium]